MKTLLLFAALSCTFYQYSSGQILCIFCYDQNDSISVGVNNLLSNGGFENTNCTPSTGVIGSPTSFCPNSNGYSCDFSNWTCTGGGFNTYACLYNTSVNKSIIIEGNNAVYFGNFYCNACSSNPDDVSCLTDSNCTVAGLQPGYPNNPDPSFGGATGVSMEQTVNSLIPGNTYVLEFWAGGEEFYAGKGLFAIDIGFGQTFLRCNSTGPGNVGTEYVIEFNAVSSSQTIRFTSWGHICSGCTELVLDNVRLYTLPELSSIVPPCGGSFSLTSFAASNTEVCEKFCVSFFDSSLNNPTAWQWEFPGGTPSSSTDQNPSSVCYQAPGTYDVTLITTSANGNDTLTLPNYITVYPTPPFPTITQVGYTLTSSIANSYQWQLNSVDIPGATNQSYTIAQTGFYTVVVGDSNSCKNSTTTYVLITGMGEVSSNTGISIFPNPASDLVTLQSSSLTNGEPVTISIINVLGEIVHQEKAAWKNSTLLHVGNLTSGIYLVSIKTEKEKFAGRLIKE